MKLRDVINTSKELKYTFGAIKALFINKKVREFVGYLLLFVIVIGLMISFMAEPLINKAGDSLAKAYQGQDLK